MPPMLKLAVPFVAATLCLGSAGCSPAQALCAKEKECESDPPGEEFMAVCTLRYDGEIRALRANKEEECHLLAEAKLRYDACRAQLDCDDYKESDLNGECEEEADAYVEAFQDADNECGTFD